ncbi:MAG TPA: maleylpyruvate isomerase N-terminal domain-containing protein [Candidatus Dormibacteraeota bacterium]|nr:maleylpyruvate isomerase N-terminal domain-containing protein [Candidatus Dormibacteraeota bacterium]
MAGAATLNDDPVRAGAPDGGLPVDLHATRAVLREMAVRAADMIATIPDPARKANRLEWSLAETAAHMIFALRVYAGSVRGDLGAYLPHMPASNDYRERMAAVTASTLSVEPERDPRRLAGLLVEAVDDFLAASQHRWVNERIPTPWYREGASLPLGAATCLLLGEMVAHGFDIARTLGRPWPIDRRTALLVVPAPFAMMPLVVDPARSRGVSARYAVHIRGGQDACITFRDGAVSVTPRGRDGGRIDCHLSADPVAFVMLGWGRLSLWSGIARGQLLAYGRRPWLGLGLRALFYNP